VVVIQVEPYDGIIERHFIDSAWKSRPEAEVRVTKLLRPWHDYQRAEEDWRAKWLNQWTTRKALDDKPPLTNTPTDKEVVILGVDPENPPIDLPRFMR
jgi:hypothetical protein